MVAMVVVPIAVSLVPRPSPINVTSPKISLAQSTEPLPVVVMQVKPVPPMDYSTFSQILAAVYGLGVLYFLIKLLLAVSEARRLRQNAQKSAMFKHQPIYQTHDVSVPISLGVIRPIILIPIRLFETLSPAEMQMIVAHELHHIQRGDHLFKIISLIIEGIWFFSPVTYILGRRFEIDMEISCDDQVLGLEICSPKNYGELLLRLSMSATSQLGWSGLGISNSFLKRRIEAMKTGQLKKRPLSQLLFASILLVSTIGISAFAVNSLPIESSAHPLGLHLGYEIKVKGELAKENQKSQLTIGIGEPILFSLKQVNIQMTIENSAAVGRQVNLVITRQSNNQVIQQTTLPFHRSELKFELELSPRKSDIHYILFELVDFASRK